MFILDNETSNFLMKHLIQNFSQTFNLENGSTKKIETDKYYPFFLILREITGIYLFPFFVIFGIIGSVFISIVYKKSQRCSTNLFLIALSFSDIVKLLNDMAYFLVSLISKIDPNLSESIFFLIYNYSHYIFTFTALNTSWLTCAIALDRYKTVVKKVVKKNETNYLQSILLSLTILFLSVIVAIPAPLFQEQIQFVDPLTNKTIRKLEDTKLGRSDFKKFYQYVIGLLRAVIPLLLLIFLNYRIIRVIYNNKIKRNNRSKSRATSMLISIFLTYIICTFPDVIMTMMQLGYANENFFIRGIREITDLLLTVNSASTFPICYFFSIQFRTKFKELFQVNNSNEQLDEIQFNEKSDLLQANKDIVVKVADSKIISTIK